MRAAIAAARRGCRPPGIRRRRSSSGEMPRRSPPACGADVVLNGITGSIGLRPTLAALARRVGAGPGQQGVAHRRWAAGQGRGRGPARSCRSTPSTAPSRRACAAAGRDEVRRLVVTASGGPFRGRSRAELADVTPRAGARAPELLDGAGHHDELGDAGQQGPRGHRGPPALRHPLRPDRRRRAPPAADPLDGRVPRRLDDRPARPAAHARADRPRAVLARAARGRRRAVRLDLRADLGVPPARRRRLPGGAARAAGRRGRRHLPGRLQRGERGVRRRLPRRRDPLHRHRRHRGTRRRGAHWE